MHPDRHLGWWWFGVGGRRGRLTVRLDFSSLDAGSVTAKLDGADVAAQSHWVNADYVREPVQDLHLVVQRGLHKVLERARVQVRESDPAVLDRYAQFVYRTSAYQPPEAPATFAQTFHAARLRQIGRLLTRHVAPGSRLLDVASGYSLFSEPAFLDRMGEWRYRVTCCDRAVDVMEARVRSVPQYGWLISDAVQLPFADGAFDAVLAGEVVEHVPSAEAALAEWGRVLRPNGTLILTTPNRRRLSNAVRRVELPMGPDHINEVSAGEVADAARLAGLRVVERRALYIEALLNWLGGEDTRFDLLQRRLNRPAFRPLMALLMDAGNLWPRHAWSLLFACRKAA